MNEAAATPAELTYQEECVLLEARALYNDQQHAFSMWQQAKEAGKHTSGYLAALKSLWQGAKGEYEANSRNRHNILRVIILDKHHKIVE